MEASRFFIRVTVFEPKRRAHNKNTEKFLICKIQSFGKHLSLDQPALPIVPFVIVTYAFTLPKKSLSQNRCEQKKTVQQEMTRPQKTFADREKRIAQLQMFSLK